MKRVIPIFAISIFLFLLSCNYTSNTADKENITIGPLVELSIPVGGMTCSGCENTVNAQLLKFKGVVEVKASHITKSVYVKVDTLLTTKNDLKTEIERIGYSIK